MRTPGEAALIRHLLDVLKNSKLAEGPESLLNIGAGQSVVVENQLTAAGAGFVEDRVDIDNPNVTHPSVQSTWSQSVEDMAQVPSGKYRVAFSNYLLEHVQDLDSAAAEIHRVLKHEGYFISTVPNPTAPEFLISRLTPRIIHSWFKGFSTWETYYAFHSISHLCRIFEQVGFQTVSTEHWPIVGNYMSRFPIIKHGANLYDALIGRSRIQSLMGDVCVVFQKK